MRIKGHTENEHVTIRWMMNYHKGSLFRLTVVNEIAWRTGQCEAREGQNWATVITEARTGTYQPPDSNWRRVWRPVKPGWGLIETTFFVSHNTTACTYRVSMENWNGQVDTRWPKKVIIRHKTSNKPQNKLPSLPLTSRSSSHVSTESMLNCMYTFVGRHAAPRPVP